MVTPRAAALILTVPLDAVGASMLRAPDGMMARLRVGIDWGMDAYSISNGQFRYAVDLFGALAKLDEDASFVVFGSNPSPPAEIASLFAGPRAAWRWRQRRPWTRRGKRFVDQAVAAAVHRTERLDLLHCIDTIIPHWAPCPVIWTLYDIMPEVIPEERVWRESPGWRRYRRDAQRFVAGHLAISQTTADDAVRAWNIDPRKVTVTLLGTTFPPPGFAALRPASVVDRFEALHDRPFLAAALNLYPRKNLDSLLAAFCLLRKDFPDLRLALFGRTGVSPEREAWFARTIAELGLGSAVVQLGFVDDLQLADLYRSATLFVYPTLYEGFGLPLLEAMAVGACVVARDASSMAEVVGDGGLLVETKGGKALAEGIGRLLRDPAERARLAARGRARAATFTLERMARVTFEVYRRTAICSAGT